MAVFNNNPSEFVDFNDLFPVLNEKVGLTYEQWRKAIENINFVKANLGVSDVDKGNVNITVVDDDTQVGLDITTREVVVEKNGVQRTVIYIDFDLKVPSGKVKSVNGKDGAVVLTAEDVGAISVGDLDIKHLVGTEEKPINLATDLEPQRYYLLSGVYSLDPTISTTLPNYTLARKIDAATVVFMNMKSESLEAAGSYLTLTIAGSGRVTNVRVGEIPNINGTFYGTTPEVYVPTSSGALGQILASGGVGAEPTWINMPESGMPQLVGTEEKPINLATDLEVGGLYLITGYIALRDGAKLIDGMRDDETGSLLILKNSATALTIYNGYIISNSGAQRDGIRRRILIDSATGFYNGHLNNYITIGEFNGFSTLNYEVDFYAPTTGGSNGTILGGTGNTGTPVWKTPVELGLATTADIEAAIGNVSSLLGDTDDLEV